MKAVSKKPESHKKHPDAAEKKAGPPFEIRMGGDYENYELYKLTKLENSK